MKLINTYSIEGTPVVTGALIRTKLLDSSQTYYDDANRREGVVILVGVEHTVFVGNDADLGNIYNTIDIKIQIKSPSKAGAPAAYYHVRAVNEAMKYILPPGDVTENWSITSYVEDKKLRNFSHIMRRRIEILNPMENI